MERVETDVLVIGAGPVGLTLTSELAYHGVRCIQVERSSCCTVLPRAFNVTVRSMESFRRLGLTAAIRKVSYPRDVKQIFSFGTQVYQGQEIFALDLDSWGEVEDKLPNKKLLYFESGCSGEIPMIIPQFALEPVLEAKVKSSPEVTFLREWELVSFDQDENGVTAIIQKASAMKDSEAPEEKTIRARYLVGCDGGRSAVRKSLGIVQYGKFVIQKVLAIYVQSPELLDIVQDKVGLGGFITKDYLALIAAFYPKECKFMVQVLLGAEEIDENHPLFRDPRPILHSIVGKEIDFKVLACYPWKAHAVVSTKFHKGNVFLCGDAAHQWIPAGGVGMNVGIGDATDLGWKLAAMLHGWGGPHLLESYHRERGGIAEQTVQEVALQFGGVRQAAVVWQFVLIIMRTPIISYIVRKLSQAFVKKSLVIRLAQTVLAFYYDRSNIVVYDEGKLRGDDPEPKDPFIPLDGPGRRAPHVETESLETIYDLFGKSYVLLILEDSKEACFQLQGEFQRRAIPLSVHVMESTPAIRRAYPKKYYLIRPDAVVGWRSDTEPSTERAKRLIDTLVGNNPPRRLLPWFSRPEKALFRSMKWLAVPLVSVSAVALFGTSPGAVLFLTVVAASLFVGLSAIFSRKEDRTQVARHKGIVMHQFGEPSEVVKMEPKRVVTFGRREILVSVRATSVTQADLHTCKGLAPNVSESSLPLALGYGCAGEVVAVGNDITAFAPGDEVYLHLPSGGAQAQYVVATTDVVALKPKNVDFVGAASLPWVSCTVWSALVKRAGLNEGNAVGKKVLVHGGSGGVGSFAIQLLKAWGASVTTTCSTDNIEFVRQLGADVIVSYRQENFVEILRHDYDVVLDIITYFNPEDTPALPQFPPDVPFYKVNLDTEGLNFGMVLEYVSELCQEGRLKPKDPMVFKYERFPDAYKCINNKAVQEQVVIVME